MKGNTFFLLLGIAASLFLIAHNSDGNSGGGKVKPPIEGVKALLIVEDKPARGALPPKQLSIFSASDVSDWCEKNGFDYKVWDVRTQGASGPLRAKFDKVVLEHKNELPWLVVSNPPANKGYDGKLPADLQATNQLLKTLE